MHYRLAFYRTAHGWSELFAGAYPHADGPDHTALFAENAEGFEVELVAP